MVIHKAEDTDLIQSLEVHHTWLSDELVKLTAGQELKAE
jgi:hypothetical protein